MKKLTMLAGASLLVIAGSVFAAEPLNEAQMDGVSAGAVATGVGEAYGLFIGDYFSGTVSTTKAFANPNDGIFHVGLATGYADNHTIATSLLGVAAASSTSSAAASIQ